MRKRQAGSYRTIKDLVLDYVAKNDGRVEPSRIEEAVLLHFPDSAWKNSHWQWYRYQICKGRFKDEFSEEVRTNLSEGIRRNRRSHPAVKRHGDRILRQARQMISEAARGDSTLRFKINRWVFSRLQQDEIQTKKPLKNMLWDSGVRACQVCGKPFSSLRGVHLHRIDASMEYSDRNCQLLCRLCHNS